MAAERVSRRPFALLDASPSYVGDASQAQPSLADLDKEDEARRAAAIAQGKTPLKHSWVSWGRNSGGSE